jgi:hypothetical protein
MRSALASLIMVITIVLSPVMREALGQIFRAKVIFGTMEMKGGLTADIEATGRKDGMLVAIRCKWVNGYPLIVEYRPLETEL